MDKIIITENFLDENELNKVIEYVNNQIWFFGHKSGGKDKIDVPFFSYNIKNEYFNDYLKKKIEKTYSKKLVLNRNYMHIQLFGQDGTYHTDDDGDNKYTFCIYISEITCHLLENAFGDFLIKIPNENIILSIDTCTNKGIFFPSWYYHKGIAYNRYFPEKRLCITWKLEEKIEE